MEKQFVRKPQSVSYLRLGILLSLFALSACTGSKESGVPPSSEDSLEMVREVEVLDSISNELDSSTNRIRRATQKLEELINDL